MLCCCFQYFSRGSDFRGRSHAALPRSLLKRSIKEICCLPLRRRHQADIHTHTHGQALVEIVVGFVNYESNLSTGNRKTTNSEAAARTTPTTTRRVKHKRENKKQKLKQNAH